LKEGKLLPGETKLYLRIPLDRLGPLIGEKGRIIRELEERTGTIITVDSENASVTIEPATPETRMDQLLRAKDFISAVAAGFSPERAWRLLEEEQVLAVIDLKNVIGDHVNHLQRIKGRIIGEKGRAKKTLEQMTGTYINIHDDKVAIIGDYESVQVAREAIQMLIDGRKHSTVYKHVDREMREIKRRRMTDYWVSKPFQRIRHDELSISDQ